MPSPLGIVASAVQGWSPLSLPDLNGWWDAADTATITEASGKVSQWDDKSGKGYHLVQATGTNQPATGTTTLNGKNVLVFDGTNDSLSVASFNMNTSVQTFSIGAVFTAASGGIRVVIEHSAVANSNPGGFYVFRWSDDTVYLGKSGASATLNNTFTGTLSTTAKYVIGTHDGTQTAANETKLWVGSSSNTSTAGAADTNTVNRNDTLYIGARAGNSFHFQGNFAELIITTGVLSTDDRTSLQDYFNAKWGL